MEQICIVTLHTQVVRMSIYRTAICPPIYKNGMNNANNR